MPFHIVRNDIIHMRLDAIVNAANEQLQRGGGVCGAIFAAAGATQLQDACNRIGSCPTGSSVATPAFALPAKHVIHTVGPIWQGGSHGEEEALRSCYRSALALAFELGDASIAFPLVSSGIYGYPKADAIDVALDEIGAFLETHEMDVYLTIFDADSLRASKGRFARVAEYIDDLYVRRSPYAHRNRSEQSTARSMPIDLEEDATPDFSAAASPAPAPPQTKGHAQAASAAPAQQQARPLPKAASPQRKARASKGLLQRLLSNLDASFSSTLMRMIDERGLKDSDVYKRANISRQHFSKIRSNRDYRPKKQTVLALAIALNLTLDETNLLLERAGFALTHADKRDIIVEYFIAQGTYDIYEINLALYAFDQPLLG